MERLRSTLTSLEGVLDTIIMFVLAGLYVVLRKLTKDENANFKKIIKNVFINIISGATLYSIAVYLYSEINEYPLKIGIIVITTMVGDRAITKVGDTLIDMITVENLKGFLSKVLNL